MSKQDVSRREILKIGATGLAAAAIGGTVEAGEGNPTAGSSMAGSIPNPAAEEATLPPFEMFGNAGECSCCAEFDGHHSRHGPPPGFQERWV
jgi:hypothetical protein